MKKLLAVSILLILSGINSVLAEQQLSQSIEMNKMINCSVKPVIKYVPINGFENSSLFYAVLINPKENKYQLISDVNGKIKCVLN